MLLASWRVKGSPAQVSPAHGPDLSRVGGKGKYDEQWHRRHFKNPRDLVPGSIMPPYPWIANNEQEFKAIVAYLQKLGRAKQWRPDNDFEK